MFHEIFNVANDCKDDAVTPISVSAPSSASTSSKKKKKDASSARAKLMVLVKGETPETDDGDASGSTASSFK